MLRAIRYLVVLAAVLAAVVASPAGAQVPPAGAVQDAIDLTDRRIELAETLAAGSDNATAQAELGIAHDLQARAKSAFAAGQPVLAGRLTLEARGHADRVIAIVRGLPDPDRVVTQVERTREILERAREPLEACDHPRVRPLVRVAVEMQARAEAALGESRFLAALQLTMSARERIFRALRLCRIEESMSESASRALQRTDDVLDRARAILEGVADGAARQALGRAEVIQGDARAEFRASRFEASLRLTQSARAMAHRAIRLAEGDPARRTR